MLLRLISMNKYDKIYLLKIQTVTGQTLSIQLPFSIQFTVTRSNMSSVNTCNIRLYNLSDLTRRAIYKNKFQLYPYRSIELFVGYGDTLTRIFKGNVWEAYSVRQRVDWITELSCMDGGFGMLVSNSSFTVTKGTIPSDVIGKLMGDLKNVTKGTIGNFGEGSSRGESFIGSTGTLLKKYTKGQFFIDGERAFALMPNEAIRGEMPLISSETGLLGSPIKEETFLKVDMIMEPRLSVAQTVELKSITQPFYNGKYQIIGISHEGGISPVSNNECKTKVTLNAGIGSFNIL
jgi:hypothetical protein